MKQFHADIIEYLKDMAENQEEIEAIESLRAEDLEALESCTDSAFERFFAGQLSVQATMSEIDEAVIKLIADTHPRAVALLRAARVIRDKIRPLQ